jgi:hemoglobin-like flavoprotein
MLTSEIALIKEDWRDIVEQEEEFSEMFYKHLFELDPDLKCLFKRSLRMQGRKVVSMFDTAINKLDQPLMLLPPLMAAGTRHLQYNVKDDHYITMCEAFIKTVAGFMGEDFSGEKERIWRRAFDLITNIMITGQTRAANAGEQFHEGVGH